MPSKSASSSAAVTSNSGNGTPLKLGGNTKYDHPHLDENFCWGEIKEHTELYNSLLRGDILQIVVELLILFKSYDHETAKVSSDRWPLASPSAV